MTEADWLSCRDPTPMLKYLSDPKVPQPMPKAYSDARLLERVEDPERERVTDRKLRLFALACSLARLIYDERAFDRMPALADSLERIGCTDPELLDHLRGPGPHVKGCWVLDLLLAKQ